jgi:hypothetical protein
MNASHTSDFAVEMGLVEVGARAYAGPPLHLRVSRAPPGWVAVPARDTHQTGARHLPDQRLRPANLQIDTVPITSTAS